MMVSMLRWLLGLARSELGTLVLVALLAGGAWVFLEVADEVMEGETRRIDRSVMLLLRSPGEPADPLGPDWFEEFVGDITAMGGTGVLVCTTLAMVGFLLLSGRRQAALLLVIAVVGGLFLSMLLKFYFGRPRPGPATRQVQVQTPSFPSTHSALSAATYLNIGGILARFQRRRAMKSYLLLLAILATFAIGVSRVYLGVHWPSDVLAGWSLGASWAAACWLLVTRPWKMRREHRMLE